MPQKITMIKTQRKKGRYNIYLDGHYSFSVSESVLIKHQLYKGQEITAQLKQILSTEDSFSQFYEKALNYLSYQLRSEKEIYTYLRKYEADPEVIAKVQQKLRLEGLVDDQKFAESYIRTMLKTSDKGFKVIQQQLRQKGIPAETITAAASEYDEATATANLQKLCLKLAKQYHNQSSKLRLQKIKQRLLSKGFSFDEITTALATLDLTNDLQSEKEALTLQFEKAAKKYRLLTSQEKKFKIKQTLYRKGFALTDIEQLLDKEIQS